MIKEVHIFGEKENKTCLAACDTQLYRVLMTNANYPTNATFEYTKEFCYVVKKLLNSFENRRRVLGKSQPKLIELLDILNKVSNIFSSPKDNKFQSEYMKSSFLSKDEPNFVRISDLYCVLY